MGKREIKYSQVIHRDRDAADSLRQIYPEEGMAENFSREVTFQVGEGCTLNCFTAETKIKTFDSYLNIENISVGDKIIGFNENTFEFIPAYIESVSKREIDKVLCINNIITCTIEHPFYNGKTYIEAIDLQLGDKILTETGVVTINSIELINEKCSVYNIQSSSSNFIANGFLVHNCSYCYQKDKTADRKMSFETGKKIVDLLYRMWDENKPDAFINKNTKMIILDFIGGEPMIYVDVMDQIVSYFWQKAIERRHPWAETFMISIATNGTLHFKPEVQKFIYKYKGHLSYGVSIDGPKDMHDACRVYYDGRGSFDDAFAAQEDYNKHFQAPSGTKATIARANLPYLSKLIKYYVRQGYQQIHANYVYEEDWNYEDAKLLYKQMDEISDYILSLPFPVELSLFDDRYFTPMSEEDNRNWCGGTGAMVAFDPVGKAYPCIRYMDSSLAGDMPGLVIGDTDGIWDERYKDVTDAMNAVTRRSQSTDECFYCPIASGCSWCFKAGTRILTPTGEKRIEELVPGDTVISASNIQRKVKDCQKHMAEDTIYLKFSTGAELYTTRNHPILTVKDGFVPAEELKIGQIVQTRYSYAVLTKKELTEPYEVYNLTIEYDNSYIANGIKVHNCSGWNYQSEGSFNKRSTRICTMHKARSLASVKHFNKLYLKNGDKKTFHRYLPDEEALKIISQEELDLLNDLEEQTKKLAPEGYDQRDYQYCSSC